MVGYPSQLVVWNPLCLAPFNGVFVCFDLATLCGCRTLNVCCCCCLCILASGMQLRCFAREGLVHWLFCGGSFVGDSILEACFVRILL